MGNESLLDVSTHFGDDLDMFLLSKGLVKTRSTKVRWLVLTLACLCGFGSYYCYDLPQPLQSMLVTDVKISTVKYDLLYSAYSLPNIILPFFGGIITDKLGVGKTMTIYSLFIIFGQLICTLGALFGRFSLLVTGRILFGIGGESLGVVQSVIAAKWFKGKELAFALGMFLCFGRIGNIANSSISPRAYFWVGGHLWGPFLLGSLTCIGSMFAGSSMASLDEKADLEEGETGRGDSDDGFKWGDLKKFKLIFYLLLINCGLYYGASAGLVNNLNDLLVQRFGFTPQSAGDAIIIVHAFALMVTPLFGFYSDYRGGKLTIILLSYLILFGLHGVLAYLPDSHSGQVTKPILALLISLGLTTAAYGAVFWPCVPLIVRQNLTGTAYGLAGASYNLMLAVVPLVVGGIHEKTVSKKEGYYWTEVLLGGMSFVGILFTIWVLVVDRRTGRKLEKPGSEIEKESLLRVRFRSLSRINLRR